MTAQINPYLNFNGQCLQAFEFYRSVFGGDFEHISYFKDLPDSENINLPSEISNRILHVSLPILGNTTLMGSDVFDDTQHQIGNNISISINLDDKKQAEQLFYLLADAGQILMPYEKTFWNAYFGLVKDRFNIQWMVNVDIT